MNVSVIGAGAWGTAIAIVLGRKGSHRVRLWVYEKEVVDSIKTRRTNDLFLPDCPIPESVEPTNSFEEALSGADIVVSVMPSHHTRRLFTQMAPHLTPGMLFVSATKGVENDSLLRMTEVIAPYSPPLYADGAAPHAWDAFRQRDQGRRERFPVAHD